MSNLKTLRKKWYKKLADKGFKDIEDSEGNLKSYASSIQSEVSPEQYVSKSRYYELAAQLLHTGYIRDSRSRFIWSLHIDGHRVPYIADKAGVSSSTTYSVIRDIQRRYIHPRRQDGSKRGKS